MYQVEVKQEKDVDVDDHQHGIARSDDDHDGSDQEIVVGIDEEHINFLTSMASGDDSLDCPPEVSRKRGRDEHDDEDEDVMATAESILSKTAERTNQQVYTCEFCNKTFTWLKSLTVHLRTHTNVKPYKCELCDRSFVRSDYLKYHMMKSHETNEQVFTCLACSGVFATNRGLFRHMRTEHSGFAERKDNIPTSVASDNESYGDIDENGKYACTYCEESFDTRDPLVVHMRRHLGEKPHKCDICLKSFIRQDFLQCHRSNHFKTLDYKNNGYTTEVSKRPRISLRKLEDLVPSNSVSRAESSDEEAGDGGASSSESEHQIVQRCNRQNDAESDEQKSLLAALLTEVSKTENDQFQCPRCDMTFPQDTSLNEHLRTHTEIDTYKCPLCDLAFIRADYLKSHLKKHIEDNGEDPGAPGAINISTVSPGVFGGTNTSSVPSSLSLLKPLNARPQSTGISLLKPPEERKPPDQPEYCIRTDDGKFMCTACERVFSHQQTVRIHYRIHTNEKPYKCSHCTESFIRSDYLERHLKVHWKDGPVITPPMMGKSWLSTVSTTDSGDLLRDHKPKIGRAGLHPENYHFIEAGDGQYACKICDQVFAHSDLLRKHALTHTEEKPFLCDICDRSFSRVDYLKEHFKSKRHRQAQAEVNGETIDDDDGSTSDTSVTGRMAKTKSPISPMTNALADRIDFKRTGDGRYKCSECDKTFVTAVTLKMHLRLHTGEKPYKCSMCSMAFIRSDYLKTHEKIHRQEAYLNQRNMISMDNTTTSGDEFEEEGLHDESKANMNGQSEIKQESEVMLADRSDEEEQQGEEEQEEDDDESEDEQVIEIMVKEEDSDDDDDDEDEDQQMDDEQEEQHEEEEEKENDNNNGYEHDDSTSRASAGTGSEPSGPKSKHRCHLCQKEFAWPKSLKIHLRTHTGERPYECDVCGKSFTRSDSLKAHRNTHGDVRVLQCHLCDASFLDGYDLIRHQQMKHGIEPLDG